jgi:hypothetical protein
MKLAIVLAGDVDAAEIRSRLLDAGVTEVEIVSFDDY